MRFGGRRQCNRRRDTVARRNKTIWNASRVRIDRVRHGQFATRLVRLPQPKIPLQASASGARKTAGDSARACLQRGTSLDGNAHIARVRSDDLTDAQWRRLEPLLPPERPRTGRPNHNHPTILNGILWILRTGAPWRDLPERYGPVGTVSSRFYRWRAAGVWDRVLAALQSQAEARNAVDWSLHF